MRAVTAALAISLLGSVAPAEVTVADTAGFVVTRRATVAAPPADAYAALGRIGQWWQPAHTYSGDARRLRLELKAGGCFCEDLADGGSVEHMRVVNAQPGKLLRLTGGLGPLQSEPVAATLTWAIRAMRGGSEIVQTYAVAAPLRTGARALAGGVDAVLAAQLDGLTALLSEPAVPPRR